MSDFIKSNPTTGGGNRPTSGGGSRPTTGGGGAYAGGSVVLPTGAGSTRENFIHIWADSNASGFLSSLKPSLRGGAEDHLDKGDTLKKVSSISDLNRFFQQHLVHNKPKIDRLDFHTHGNSGFISLGSDQLFYEDIILNFIKKGYEKVFNNNARIFFHGCNVAEGGEGELFLALFGGTFLRKGGGRVGASTGAGYGLSFVGGPSSWHPTGNTVYAYVQPGGSTSLKNHSVLIPGKILARIKSLEIRVSNFNGNKSTKIILQQQISKAKKEIGPGVENLETLLAAHKIILVAEQTLDKIRSKLSPPYR